MTIHIVLPSHPYLYKYVYKGHDRVAFSPTESLDEIQQYPDARYISASLAITTSFGFEMQVKTVTVVQLPIHLENRQSIVLRETESVNSSCLPVLLPAGSELTRTFQIITGCRIVPDAITTTPSVCPYPIGG
uniref:Uncharacterized protein n=1 Tax=Anopheles atroparvus TaxID=41427 RepID=A0AAG5DR75_ANOAO